MTTHDSRIPVAIIGSGNIGSDLMIKILRISQTLKLVAMVGVDPDSDGLARARRLGIPTTAEGIDALAELVGPTGVDIVFDATSASAHAHNQKVAAELGAVSIDLTPAAMGPFVVPPVNLGDHLDQPDISMVTCGGQATIPIVAAISAVAPVRYAEIVASIASRSAGPGTRANIDEFTETTSRAIAEVGGADKGKAIIILNPAEPPLLMRDTVTALCDDIDADAVVGSITAMVAEVARYVPGYRLKHPPQVAAISADYVPALDGPFTGKQVTVFLEVSGAGHYLPDYAGNLDIMTSAALATAEKLMQLRAENSIRRSSTTTATRTEQS
ncbi:acetaldehyde dehydrogenase (acetylating) [Microbacterium sp. YY-01]|uniref:acetaldehyde dehydrogenase (acetylating) n=1 Tax=Microbacterium sp. YY-01 TaxID=3421634 RepID=UPI003D17BF4A